MANTLDPKSDPLDSPESPNDNEPDTIATPEGDNEYPPDQPLTPHRPPVDLPRGDEPHSEQPIRKAGAGDWKTDWDFRIHGVNLIPGQHKNAAM